MAECRFAFAAFVGCFACFAAFLALATLAHVPACRRGAGARAQRALPTLIVFLPLWQIVTFAPYWYWPALIAFCA